MTTKKPAKAGPKGSARKKVLPSKEGTPMPVSKAKIALGEYLQGRSIEERLLIAREIEQHPDHVAMRKLEDLLTRAHFAEEVRASPVMSDFVFLMREVLAEFVPGTELGDLVEPLRHLMSQFQAQKASKFPRPSSRSPIRSRIVQMMKRERGNGIEFKVLMDRWKSEAIDDLQLTQESENSDRYSVMDFAMDAEATYTWKTLGKLFSTG